MDKRGKYYYVVNLGSMNNIIVNVLKSMGCDIHRLVKDKNNYISTECYVNGMRVVRLKGDNAKYYFDGFKLKITVPKYKNKDFIALMEQYDIRYKLI